ncbi:hypothetical protein LTR86_010099 [Recurvomyces mirabilis]|nr:hypothetical protein LTR86_010099 [Recurvomyces mirabilis]
MGAPIAIFPLINTARPEAAVGILLKTFDEFNTLMEAPGIEVATSSASDFDSQTEWLCENSAHDMSSDETSTYASFLDLWDDDGDIWTVLVEHHLNPEHAATFRQLGLYLRGSEDRKFKRLPEPVRGTIATSAHERDDLGYAVNGHCKALDEQVNPVWSAMLRTIGEDRIAEQIEDDYNEHHPAYFQPSVETTTEDESDEQCAEHGESLMDELAERYVLLTGDEAEMLEAVWIVYGDRWQKHY